MAGSLEGRAAIVTGAASGIGRAIAEAFVSDGAQVLAVDRQSEGLSGPWAQALTIDVTEADAADKIVSTAVAAFGKLEILVNNAGITAAAPVEETGDDLWRRMFAVNVDALFFLTRAALPRLKAAGWGRIINTGSIMSEFGGAGLSAYAASKHAVAGFTKAVASEVGAHNITANYIQPGAVESAMTEPYIQASPEFRGFWENRSACGRWGTPDDIAPVAVFLGSDGARFVNGRGLIADGGAMQAP